MGRNRKKKGSGRNNATISEKEIKLQHEYEVIIDAVRELLCFWKVPLSSVDSNSNQEAFLDSLEKIIVCLESISNQGYDDQHPLQFLRIENIASQIRICGEAYLFSLSRQRRELLETFDEFKSSIRAIDNLTKNEEYDHPFDPTKLAQMATLILSQCFQQIDLERNVVSSSIGLLSKLYLSFENSSSHDEFDIYSSNDLHTLCDRFKTHALSIQSKIYLDKDLFEGALSLVQEIKDALANRLSKIQSESQAIQNSHEKLQETNFNREELIQPPIVKSFIPEGKDSISYDPSQDLSSCIVNTSSLTHAIETFVEYGNAGVSPLRFSSSCVLLVGPSGSGKTFLCNQIHNTLQKQTGKESCKVVYPKLPVDLMGHKVGTSEEILVSFFSKMLEFGLASSSTNKCILILDGMDHILGNAYSETTNVQTSANSKAQSLLILRLRATFTSLIDYIKQQNLTNQNEKLGSFHFLLLCTSRTRGDSISDRFDKIFTLVTPNAMQRQSIIISCLYPSPPDDSSCPDPTALQNIDDDVLGRLVSCTVGRSASEISQSCRDVVAKASPLEGNIEISKESSQTLFQKRLLIMDQLLHNIAPESIRAGALDGFVDLKISTSKELVAELQNIPSKSFECPLYGSQADEAWKRLKSLIVAPLCQAKELDYLLYGNFRNVDSVHRGGKIVCAGVLLTGPPGSGKSVLARHCSSVAAHMLPAIRLLDVSCTSLIHKELGGTERAIEKLFSAAKAAAPCILLLDGIENIAPLRGNDNTTEGTMDRALSTLLIEMDGVDDGSINKDHSAGNRVAIIGITHDPNLIDPALRRPGRLEKCITLKHPDSNARAEIFINEAKSLPLDFSEASFVEPKNVEELGDYVAFQTNGWSAAEIKAICAEASMFCLRERINEFGGLDKSLNVKVSELKIRHSHILSALNVTKMKG